MFIHKKKLVQAESFTYDQIKSLIANIILLFAGLGEMMPEQLWETTMNPETRILKQLAVDDIAEANIYDFIVSYGFSGKATNSTYHICLSQTQTAFDIFLISG